MHSVDSEESCHSGCPQTAALLTAVDWQHCAPAPTPSQVAAAHEAFGETTADEMMQAAAADVVATLVSTVRSADVHQVLHCRRVLVM